MHMDAAPIRIGNKKREIPRKIHPKINVVIRLFLFDGGFFTFMFLFFLLTNFTTLSI